MMDYRLLEALAAVVDEGGFERAGDKLGLTQSAVSQRVRQLEEQEGTLLVLRETPPRPTPAGQGLLGHFRQVQALEAEVVGVRSGEGGPGFVTVGLAVNDDSLSTWFLGALLPVLTRDRVLVDVKVDDQDLTLRHLKSGAVSACISSRKESLTGCVSRRLGSMEYRLCATPEFRDRWFADGFTAPAAAQAPIVHYGRDDDLQNRSLAQCFSTGAPVPPSHFMPSTEKIYEMILSGCTYAMVPMVQGAMDLAAGRLAELDPAGRISVDLYWHRWSLATAVMGRLEEAVTSRAQALLGQG